MNTKINIAVITCMTVLWFSCKEAVKENPTPAANTAVSRVVSDTFNAGLLPPVIAANDTLSRKKTKAHTPDCCKGAPSRFGYKVKETKRK